MPGAGAGREQPEAEDTTLPLPPPGLQGGVVQCSRQQPPQHNTQQHNNIVSATTLTPGQLFHHYFGSEDQGEDTFI